MFKILHDHSQTRLKCQDCNELCTVLHIPGVADSELFTASLVTYLFATVLFIGAALSPFLKKS